MVAVVLEKFFSRARPSNSTQGHTFKNFSATETLVLWPFLYINKTNI